VDPGFTATDLNNNQGTRTVEEGAREPVPSRSSAPMARPARPARAGRGGAAPLPHRMRRRTSTTPYASPHLESWELDDAQWHKVTARPYERRPRPADSGARQLPLPVVGLLAVFSGR